MKEILKLLEKDSKLTAQQIAAMLGKDVKEIAVSKQPGGGEKVDPDFGGAELAAEESVFGVDVLRGHFVVL